MTNLIKFCREQSCDAQSFSVINILLQVGEGLGVHYFTGFELALKRAIKREFVIVINNKVYLTDKSNELINNILTLKELGYV